MNVCGKGVRLAFQPETQQEQLALYRLFSKVSGSWFTMDVGEYPNLDPELAEDRTALGSFAPGSRALVVDEAPPMPTAEGAR